MGLITAVTILFVIVSYIATHIFLDSFYRISPAYLLYLIATKQLKHYIEKKKLVNGDLIFIRYRGKLRKAYVTSISHYDNAVQAKFFDNDLNIDLIKTNWYPLSRVTIPDFMGKAAKVLYLDLED
jgi:hypothetical protein